MKVATIIGARPQFVKAAQVSRAFKAAAIEEIILHTGQHYDPSMSDIFFEEMQIPKPNYFLGVGGLSQGAMTGRMLEQIEEILMRIRPDFVLVYGDTNTTLAGALAAAKLHIPIAHVEAGLRSYNKAMPEEINRVLVDHLASLLFTPTPSAKLNLLKEGISEALIHETGDVMADALFFYSKLAENNGGVLEKWQISPKKYILATIHRQENTDSIEKLTEIIEGFLLASEKIQIVLPLHPRTEKMLKNYHLYEKAAKLTLIPPVGYFDMLMLEKNAERIATDSGGVQKEAYLFKIPCCTLRTETEWKELVDHGYSTLVQTSRQEIYRHLCQNDGEAINWDTNLYGTGNASESIVASICKGR